MGKNFSYNLYYDNIITNLSMNKSFSEESGQKVKYIYATPWIESPFFWFIFSINSANIFGFIHFDNYKSEGILSKFYFILLELCFLRLLKNKVLLNAGMVSSFVRVRFQKSRFSRDQKLGF